jgi:3-hydroxyisobutyrate dehydrogenase-like beta-hydroxyacid dehydrogenase
MLPNSDIVGDFLFGTHDVASKVKNSTLLIDCSTIGPVASGQLYDLSKKKELTFVDAPVSGGVKGADEAKLTFMIGAENNKVFEVT